LIGAGCEAESIGDLSLEQSFLLVHKLHTHKKTPAELNELTNHRNLTSTHKTSRMAKKLHEDVIDKLQLPEHRSVPQSGTNIDTQSQ
jgi:hypothetical protein